VSLFKKVWEGGLKPSNSKSIPPNSSSCSLIKAFPFFVYHYESSKNKLKVNLNAVDLAMYLLMHRVANAGVNQPTTNLKPRTSTIANVNSEKVKICTSRLLFVQMYVM